MCNSVDSKEMNCEEKPLLAISSYIERNNANFLGLSPSKMDYMAIVMSKLSNLGPVTCIAVTVLLHIFVFIRFIFELLRFSIQQYMYKMHYYICSFY